MDAVEPSAYSQFLAVYEDLRRLARMYLRTGDRHTLQPTALVHEAYLKLVDADPERWESKEHFVHAAARAMRQILVHHARRKLAQKRRNDGPVVDDAPGPDMAREMVNLIHLEDAIGKLEKLDPELGHIVELRFFVGCTSQETAELLELPERTVRYRWSMAKAFLSEQLETDSNG